MMLPYDTKVLKKNGRMVKIAFLSLYKSSLFCEKYKFAI